MQTGLSLHSGLNAVDPVHYDGWDGALAACEFDAADMAELAAKRNFETTPLLGAKATAKAVVAAIRKAAKRLSGGDIFFITSPQISQLRGNL